MPDTVKDLKVTQGSSKTDMLIANWKPPFGLGEFIDVGPFIVFKYGYFDT